jgi:hypothetical protein
MDDLEFEAMFEQVYDFASELKYKLKDVPYFEGQEDVEDYLKEAYKICDEWIERNRERFEKIYYNELKSMNEEFERSVL